MLFPSLCGGGELHVVSALLARDSDRFFEYASKHNLHCLKITPKPFCEAFCLHKNASRYLSGASCWAEKL